MPWQVPFPHRPNRRSSASDFQARFEKERDNRYYPHGAGPGAPHGTVQYRGEFYPFPPDMAFFMSRRGMADPGYRQSKRELESQGFALLALRTTDPRLIGLLDEFVAVLPDSWIPLLLRAIHQTELGWNERGTKYAADTSEEQFSKMRKRFDLARADLKQMVRRAPGVAAAQEYRIIIAKADGPGDIRREALEQALEELSRALSDPTLDRARARRAWLFARHGYPAEAAEDYRKLLQVYPGDADYQAGLRHVTEHLKAVDEARGGEVISRRFRGRRSRSRNWSRPLSHASRAPTL